MAKKSYNQNNKAAEKWTLEDAIIFSEEMLDLMERRNDIRTIGKAALKMGHYAEIIAYFTNKWPDHDFKAFKKARELAKERLIDQALDNEVSTGMAIFVLKNNHGMTDRVENDINLRTEQPLFGDDED